MYRPFGFGCIRVWLSGPKPSSQTGVGLNLRCDVLSSSTNSIWIPSFAGLRLLYQKEAEKTRPDSAMAGTRRKHAPEIIPSTCSLQRISVYVFFFRFVQYAITIAKDSNCAISTRTIIKSSVPFSVVKCSRFVAMQLLKK